VIPIPRTSLNAAPAIVVRATLLCALAVVGACTRTSGWSPEQRQDARELCLTQVGDSFEFGKAQAYCGCLVAKTIEQFPTYADADKLGTGKDGDRLGDECVEELHLTERDSAPSGDASRGTQPSVAADPRPYGDWQVVFVAADPSVDEVDTWQAVTSDASGGSLLSYICEPGSGCGLLLLPETKCGSSAEKAPFSLLFTQDGSRTALNAAAECLPNGAWAFDSPDPILDQIRGLPDTVRLSLRGADLEFSLDGATNAFAYAERAASEHAKAADPAPPQLGLAPPQSGPAPAR
jgi:hypothetical protein